jgi:hypothetical protein
MIVAEWFLPNSILHEVSYTYCQHPYFSYAWTIEVHTTWAELTWSMAINLANLLVGDAIQALNHKDVKWRKKLVSYGQL